ncbi:Uncharacterised protein [Mycobacterium tuberculosis]|nr:Uncharacterised protein [Mycobacterium tuberculosis]
MEIITTRNNGFWIFLNLFSRKVTDSFKIVVNLLIHGGHPVCVVNRTIKIKIKCCFHNAFNFTSHFFNFFLYSWDAFFPLHTDGCLGNGYSVIPHTLHI